MVGPDVAVVDGGLGLRGPARLRPVGVGPDLSQEPQLQRLVLVVSPGGGRTQAGLFLWSSCCCVLNNHVEVG